MPISPLDYDFDSNATYIITGGLGGIGRSLAMWMSRNGARHLCLLSRSGAITQAAKDLIAALQHGGVRVYAPICDVSDSKAVLQAVTYINAHMPPIKGCIHGAMAIEVSALQLTHHCPNTSEETHPAHILLLQQTEPHL